MKNSESKTEAIEKLAYELNWKLVAMCPGDGDDWENYDDHDKHIFRECIHWLLAHRRLINEALNG